MRVALLNLAHFPRRSHPRHHLAPLDLGILASLLRAQGHAASFADSAVDGGPDTAIRALLAARPDLLVVRPAVHALADLGAALATAAADEVPVLAAGPVATVLGERLLADLPALAGALIGEPEAILPGLLAAWQGQGPLPDVAGLAQAGRPAGAPVLVPDLDALPLPDHALFLARPYRFGYPLATSRRLRMGYLLTARGCPHACTFCSPLERASLGKTFRAREPRAVAAEALHLQRLGATGLYLEDDVVALGPERLAALAQAFLQAGLRLPWAFQARAGTLDLPTARLVARARGSTVCVGVESGDPAVLRRLDKRLTTDDLRAQFAILRQAGLLTVAFVIVGAPGETAASTELTRRLVRELAPDLLQVHFHTPYPGSRDGAAQPSFPLDPYATKFARHAGTTADPHQARAALYRDFYLSPATWARALQHAGFWAANLPTTLRLGAGLLARLR